MCTIFADVERIRCNMKEFIDKLISRLNKKARWVAYSAWDRDIGMTHKVVPFSDLREIVNQLAEEYKEDCCECKHDYKFISDKYKVETGCGYTFYDLHHAEPFKFCPYCGKKIKVAPYTEGE